MKIIVFIFTIIIAGYVLYNTSANENNGLITKQSSYTVAETLDRLEGALSKKGVTIFARISHSKNAKKVGISLRPTELLIFGNPKLGSQLFTSKQISGIDLPMKALVWQDEHGKVWLVYNSPVYIAKQHKINNRDDVIVKMTKALNMFTNIATTKQR